MNRLGHCLKMLGPGLLFAGAAVGTSHLYWSTKAGAEHGFAFLWAIVLILIFKYPFFEYGTRYTAAKGETILSGYKRMGKWVLWAYLILTPITMFTIQAAVTYLTASILMYLFGIPFSTAAVSALLLALCLGILYVGKFSVLDHVIKYIIILLTISTFIAVVLAMGKVEHSISFAQHVPSVKDSVALGFVISLMGWMPAPVDMSVWNSVWAESKQKVTKEDFDYGTSLMDFNVGYWSTLVLAIFFLSLGALVMHGSGTIFESGGMGFSKQLFGLYSEAFGTGNTRAFWLIGIAALTTMFSTTLTCLDALPRVMGRASVLSNTHLPDINGMGTRTTLDDLKSADFNEAEFERRDRKAYWIWMAVLVVGSMVIILFFTSGMGSLLRIATVLSFLTTPFYAIANYLLITSEHTPEFARPGLRMRVLSWLGIVFLSGFSILYIYTMWW